MSHAGSCLTEREWRVALDASVAGHKQHIEQQLLSGPVPPQAAPDLEDRVLNTLAKIAQQDKAYAWWSSHQYQRLGATELTNNPLFKNAPSQLTQIVNQQKQPKPSP